MGGSCVIAKPGLHGAEWEQIHHRSSGRVTGKGTPSVARVREALAAPDSGSTGRAPAHPPTAACPQQREARAGLDGSVTPDAYSAGRVRWRGKRAAGTRTLRDDNGTIDC